MSIIDPGLRLHEDSIRLMELLQELRVFVLEAVGLDRIAFVVQTLRLCIRHDEVLGSGCSVIFDCVVDIVLDLVDGVALPAALAAFALGSPRRRFRASSDTAAASAADGDACLPKVDVVKLHCLHNLLKIVLAADVHEQLPLVAQRETRVFEQTVDTCSLREGFTGSLKAVVVCLKTVHIIPQRLRWATLRLVKEIVHAISDLGELMFAKQLHNARDELLDAIVTRVVHLIVILVDLLLGLAGECFPQCETHLLTAHVGIHAVLPDADPLLPERNRLRIPLDLTVEVGGLRSRAAAELAPGRFAITRLRLGGLVLRVVRRRLGQGGT
jgi:hypothetical protein